MFQSHEGKKVPHVTFRTRQGDQWADITTEQLFAGMTTCASPSTIPLS